MRFNILKVLFIICIGLFYEAQVGRKTPDREDIKPQKVFLEGTRGWREDGTNLWTSVSPLPIYNVGIGTSTPAYKLDVVGNSRIQGDLYINSWPIRVTSAPPVGYVLKWNGSAFVPATDENSGGNVSGSGSPTQVAFWTGTYTISGNSNLWWDNTNARLGIGTSTPYYKLHVIGSQASGSGTGLIHAVNTATNSDAAGVYGECASTDYYGYGGYFKGGWRGVYGTVSPTGSSSYYGVYGYVSGGSGSNVGAYGWGEYGRYNWGVYAYGYGGLYTYGVSGYGSGASNENYGVYGSSSYPGYGVYGYANDQNRCGVAGQNANTSGTGVFGLGNGLSSFWRLTAGSGGSFTGTQFGCAGFATNTSGNRAGGYFATTDNSAYAYVGFNWSGSIYKINGPGAVSTIMDTRNGKKNLFAPESPEAVIIDYGEGRLIEGRAKIKLDPLFLDCVTINENNPIKVFVQLKDDCNGVYVKTYNDGFEVIELKGGKSNASFSYMVVAKWKGYEKLRFPDAPPPQPIATQNISQPTMPEEKYKK